MARCCCSVLHILFIRVGMFWLASNPLSFATHPAVRRQAEQLHCPAGVVAAIHPSQCIRAHSQVLLVLCAVLTTRRAMALNAEQLHALLAVVLGVSNLALLFLNKALAYEQQTSDKASLNLEVLQKQVS